MFLTCNHDKIEASLSLLFIIPPPEEFISCSKIGSANPAHVERFSGGFSSKFEVTTVVEVRGGLLLLLLGDFGGSRRTSF